MLKIWKFAFQQTPGEPLEQPQLRANGLALVAMLFLIVGLGFAAGPVQQYSSAAAIALLERSEYDEAVLNAVGRPELPQEVR